MHEYNTSPPTDELGRAQAELAQVKDIMVQNVEQILSRGERIELLVDKTDNMASQVRRCESSTNISLTCLLFLYRQLPSAEVRAQFGDRCGGRTARSSH
jgi:hypothetical protein